MLFCFLPVGRFPLPPSPRFHESDGNVDDDPNNNVTLETNAPNNQTTTYTSSEYARAPLSTGASTKESSQSNWNVGADWHRSFPSFYPLEKSNRKVNDVTASVVSGRVSDCCRLLSVQAEFDDLAVSFGHF